MKKNNNQFIVDKRIFDLNLSKSIYIVLTSLINISDNRFLQDYTKISLQITKHSNYLVKYGGEITGIFINKDVIDEKEITDFGWEIKKYVKLEVF